MLPRFVRLRSLPSCWRHENSGTCRTEAVHSLGSYHHSNSGGGGSINTLSRRGLALLAAMGLTWLVAACWPFTSSAPPPTSSGGKARLLVRVEWNNMPVAGLPSAKGLVRLSWIEDVAWAQSTSDVNVVGARLEYPKEGATFLQSVTRERSETEGVITLEVPATDYADLFVVGMRYSGDTARASRPALLFGVRMGLRLDGGSTQTFRLHDLALSVPGWFAEDASRQSELLQGYVDIEETNGADLPIWISDPFQPGRKFRWDEWEQRIARVEGFSVGTDDTYRNGMRRFVSRVSGCGYAGCRTRSFLAPYVAGSMFRLPANAYVPPVVGDDGWFEVR